jgi:hypothetical protein
MTTTMVRHMLRERPSRGLPAELIGEFQPYGVAFARVALAERTAASFAVQ